AALSAARCDACGWPPVTTPGRGSDAFVTPAIASRSWLMDARGGRLRTNSNGGGRVRAKIAATLLAVLPVFHQAAAQATQSPIHLSGYLQPRLQAIGDSAGFLLRRARIAVEGNITPWARARIQVEFRTWVTPAAGTSPAAQA